MPYIGNIVQDFSVNTAMLNSDSVTSIKIDDGTIVNADINDSAAIAGTKISPDFGSQNIVTTGTFASDNITVTGATPKVTFTDNDANPDYEIRNHSGYFAIRDATNDANKIRVNPDGHIDIFPNLDCEAGIDVTGNITATGSITSSAGEISTTNGSVVANKGTNNQVILGHDGAVEISRNGGGAFIDFKNDPSEDHDARIQENNGGFDISGNVNIASGLDVTGAITGTGDLTLSSGDLILSSGQIRATDTIPAIFKRNVTGTNTATVLIGNNTQTFAFAADSNGFSINDYTNINVQRLFIQTSTGRVGIGTNTPSEQLETVGNIRATTQGSDDSIILNNTGSIEMTRSAGAFIDFKDANEDHDCRIKQESNGLAFTTGGQGSTDERMRIDSAGKVGIGTGSPQALFEISGANNAVVGISLGHALGSLTSSRYIGITQNGNANNLATNSGFQGIEFGGPGSAAEGYLALHTHDNGVSSGERLRIDKSGNVGIGLTSPNTKLDVNGATTIRVANSTSYQSGFNVTNSVTTDLQVWIKNNAVAIGPSTASNINFVTQGNGNVRMVVQDNGNVGIGRTGPEARLDVESPTLGGTSGNQQDLIRIKSPDVTNNTRYIFRNFRFANGTSHESSELRFFRKVDVTDMGYVGLRNQAITFGYGADEGMRMADDRTVSIGRTSSEGSQLMVDNQGNGRNSIRISQAHQTALAQFTEVSNASYAGDGFKYHLSRAANSAFNFMAFDSAHASTPDREFTIRGDGNAYADGTWNNNGADYAEFFESSTGSAIPVGTAVVLDNNKVRAATSSDAVGNIIGVVRPKEPSQASMTIGNTAWNKWQGKYLTDDFDRFILDEHTVINWTDADGTFHSYESHAIPSDVTVPSDATTLTTDAKGNKFTHYRLNPAYDSSKTYVPREDRDEWVIIGLVGQVKVLKGEVVNDRWIKMRDVSDTVEEYFIR